MTQERKRFIALDEPFVCGHCGLQVQPIEGPSYRSHCPYCLYSRHVDLEVPGDRAHSCQGMMEPVGVERVGEKLVIHHRCKKCGEFRRNKSAADDDVNLLIDFSARPLS